MTALGDRSLRALEGVHPDLVRVVLRAAAGPTAFIVTEGRRSAERQAQLVAAGKSRTLASRHLTGHAVDLAVLAGKGVISWARPDYKILALQVKAAASELGVQVVWGGDWEWFDGPHFELSRKAYPEASWA